MYDPASALYGTEAVFAHLDAHGPQVTTPMLRHMAIDAKWDRNELTLTIAPECIPEAGEAARAAGYNFLTDVTAVDWAPSEPRFQVTYHLLSHAMKKEIRLIARVEGDSPALPTITTVWPAANFYEREVFDLFGIHFTGHPNMSRIMMPTDWKGHPLRKDYPVEGYR